MPQTPPPDDFPQKPIERPIIYSRATRNGRWHIVVGPVPQRGPWPAALCGFVQLRGWRYRIATASSTFGDEQFCPRCLSASRRAARETLAEEVAS